MTLLNDYDKDSLQIIMSDNFQSREATNSHVTGKVEFLDSFITHSRAINGKFRIVRKISQTEPAVFLVEDLTDYSKYLDLKQLKWMITITSKNGKIEQMLSDTTAGFQDYMDDLTIKHDNFVQWLTMKYPNETESYLFNNPSDLFSKRLKEYSTSK
jgi:hypothetical protein